MAPETKKNETKTEKEEALDKETIDKQFDEHKSKALEKRRKLGLEKKIEKARVKIQVGHQKLFYGLILEVLFIAYLFRDRSRIFDVEKEFLVPFGYLDGLCFSALRCIAMMQTYLEPKKVYLCGQVFWFLYIISCMAKFLHNLFCVNWMSFIGWVEFVLPLVFLGTYQFLGCLSIDSGLTEIKRAEEDLSQINEWRNLGRLERVDVDLQDEVSRWDVYWLIWEFSKIHKKLFLQQFFALNVNYASRAYAPFIMAKAINRLVDENVLDSKLFLFAFLCGTLGEGIGRSMEWWVTIGLDWELKHDFKVRLYEKMLSLEVGFFDTHSTGQLNSMINHHMSNLASRVAWSGRMVGEIFVTFFWTIFFAIQISARLTLATFVALPLIFWLSSTIGDVLFHERKAFSEVREDSPKFMNEGISNIRVVKQFRAEDHELKLYNQAHVKASPFAARCKFYDSIWLGVIFGCPSALSSIILYSSCRLVFQGVFSIGNVVAFMSYNEIMAWMFNLGGSEFVTINQTFGEAYKCFQILKRENSLPFKNVHDGSKIDGDLELKNIHFAYPKAPGRKVIDGMSLKVKAGEVVALVGESGGGKSTVVKLFTRLFAPQSGEVLIDGKQLSDFEPKSLFQNIAVVPQDPLLFGRTVRQNITYGLRREISEEELYEAAKMAQIHDFVMDLEHGYETEIGERGVTLSGGQKQRVSIARAIIRDPKVLFLDEATASLDSESEHLVHQAIDKIMEQKKVTSIIIAHRLSTIMDADRILVIAGGKVIEEGNHESLMEKGCAYSKFVERQRLIRDKKKKKKDGEESSEESSEEKISPIEEAGDENTSANTSTMSSNTKLEPTEEVQKVLEAIQINTNIFEEEDVDILLSRKCELDGNISSLRMTPQSSNLSVTSQDE